MVGRTKYEVPRPNDGKSGVSSSVVNDQVPVLPPFIILVDGKCLLINHDTVKRCHGFELIV